MTPPPSVPEPQPHGITPVDAPVAAPLINPNLGATLSADYEALQNDMQQAKELAADFQRQLAGKSNEFAQLKQLFEKTISDLAQLQTGIVELRAERHRLANEAMRATAFQLKLNKVTSERDQLGVELELVRAALGRSAEEMARTLHARDTQIAGLVIELVTLKDTLAEERRAAGRGHPAKSAARDAAPETPAQITVSGGPKAEAADQFIDISFGS